MAQGLNNEPLSGKYLSTPFIEWIPQRRGTLKLHFISLRHRLSSVCPTAGPRIPPLNLWPVKKTVYIK